MAIKSVVQGATKTTPKNATKPAGMKVSSKAVNPIQVDTFSASTPQQAAANAALGLGYQPSSSGGGGDYSGGGGGSAAPAMSQDDYLAGDSAYQAQLASLQRALQDWTADDTAQRTKYNTDYSQSLKDLGWMDDDPTTVNAVDPGWNQNDLNTASGRSIQNQLDDFASRGMLQSTAFATAKDNLLRQFNDQKSTIDKAKADYLADRDRQLLAQQHSEQDSINQAKAASLARMASGLALS